MVFEILLTDTVKIFLNPFENIDCKGFTRVLRTWHSALPDKPISKDVSAEEQVRSALISRSVALTVKVLKAYGDFAVTKYLTLYKTHVGKKLQRETLSRSLPGIIRQP